MATAERGEAAIARLVERLAQTIRQHLDT
jgi:hypothetical protein